jgi:Flp pilus assembly pilin Flp
MDVRYWNRFFKDERGQGVMEYALIIAFVALVAIGVLTIIGSKADNDLNNAALHLVL